jgi:hypothetical protein
MEIAKLVLEYVRAMLSPQVVAGAIVVVAFIAFKDDLGALFRGGFRLRSPSGYELSASQRERSSDDKLMKAPPVPPSVPTNPSPQQTQEVISAYKAQAALWEYRYLHHFLARSTQLVLDWLAGLPMSTTVQMADAWWLPIIPDAQERRAILAALQAHYLVELDGDLIKVTDKGREYLRFRGPLPPLPKS